MPAKYYYRPVVGDEFKELMRDAGVSVAEFQILSGRHFLKVKAYMEGTENPTMADVAILEAIRIVPDLKEDLIEFSKNLILGDSDGRTWEGGMS